MTGVVVTDSCFYFTGVVADSVFPYNVGSLFAKYDPGGTLQFHKAIVSPDRTYATWRGSIAAPDGGIAQAGDMTDSVRTVLLLKLDSEGDSVFTKRYPHPLFPDYEFITPGGGMELATDKGFIIANTLESYGGIADLYLIRTDSTGEVLWDSIINSSGITDLATSIISDGQGSFLVGGWTSDYNLVLEDFTSRARIIKFAESGEILWEYLTPTEIGLRDGANDMVLLEDGSLVIASGRGTEIERPTGNTIYFDKHVFKLSPDHEIEWEVTFEDVEPNVSSHLSNIVEISDGSGFVIAGTEGEDTPGTGTYAVRGWLAKVSTFGETAWTRQYVGIDNDNPRHTIYDLKETPDGGLIVCGESKDGTGETDPKQQAWLLKLDKHGCLVPGCHLTDGAGGTEQAEIELAIYPNPAVDYLNFQLRGGGFGKKGSFRIVNMDGEIVREFTEGQAGDTYIVPVWEWAAGVYFLQYIKEAPNGQGEILLSEKFIKP